jgi:hypothetical protein
MLLTHALHPFTEIACIFFRLDFGISSSQKREAASQKSHEAKRSRDFRALQPLKRWPRKKIRPKSKVFVIAPPGLVVEELKPQRVDDYRREPHTRPSGAHATGIRSFYEATASVASIFFVVWGPSHPWKTNRLA